MLKLPPPFSEIQYTTNSKGQRARIGRVGEPFNVPVIAKVYPEDAPYWNEENQEYWAYQAFSIRKLTEGECLRLMDVPEEMIKAMCEFPSLSRSSIYKLAGNSIVVACLRLIFKNIYNSPYVKDADTMFAAVPFRAPKPDVVNLVTLCSGYDSQNFHEVYNRIYDQLKADNGTELLHDSNCPIAAGNHADYVSLSKGTAYAILSKDAKSMIYLVTNVYNEPE